MTIFKSFFGQNFSKIFSETHQIAPFLKIFSGEHAPSCKYPHFSRNILNPPPPPPPRNEILDTPLS